MRHTVEAFHRVTPRASLLLGLLLLLASAAVRAGEVSVEVRADADLFYEQLAPYGQWLPTPEYGAVWKPKEVPPGWRPYTLGEWSYTEKQGWLWTSYWPWGWATFHYGRWTNHPDHGWVWVPGTEWAPAWVAWRMGDGMIGWAPLPPETKWQAGKGLSADHRKMEEKLPFYAWSFVPQARIFSKELHTKEMILSARNVNVLPRTENITDYRTSGSRIINVGPDINRLAKDAAIEVKKAEMIDVTFPAGIKATKLEAGQIAVFRPMLGPELKFPPLATSIPVDPNLSAKQAKRQLQLTRSALEAYHQSESAQLQRLHNKELEQSGTTPGQNRLRQQHAAETQALSELHRWENHTLEFQLRQTARAYGIDETLENPAPGPGAPRQKP
ncbi:MAG: DUF6600 domain-containing protein [Pseudomonadota bacterium]